MLGDVSLRLRQRSIELFGVGDTHINEIDGIIEYCPQMQKRLTVGAKTGEGLKRNENVIIKLVDIIVQNGQTCREGELPMERSGERLHIDGQFFAACGFLAQQDLTVFHVTALHHFAVYKHQKLRVLSLIAIGCACADVQKDGLSIQFLRYGHVASKPVVGAGDASEIRDIGRKLAFKPIAAVIIGMPFHGGTVKIFPWSTAFVCLLWAEELSLFVLPTGNAAAAVETEHSQLIADNFDSLFNKVHGNSSHFFGASGLSQFRTNGRFLPLPRCASDF